VKRDTEKNCNQMNWALLLTAKQDTVKTCNQISEKLWGALSGKVR